MNNYYGHRGAREWGLRPDTECFGDLVADKIPKVWALFCMKCGKGKKGKIVHRSDSARTLKRCCPECESADFTLIELIHREIG